MKKNNDKKKNKNKSAKLKKLKNKKNKNKSAKLKKLKNKKNKNKSAKLKKLKNKKNKNKSAKLKKLKSINAIINNKKSKKDIVTGKSFNSVTLPNEVIGPMIANPFDLKEKTFLMFGLNNKYTYSSDGINWVVSTYPLYDYPVFAQSFKGNIYVLGLLGNIATYVPGRGWLFRNITFPNNKRVKSKFLFFSNDGLLGLYAQDNKIYWSAESSDLSQGNYNLNFNLRTTISKSYISSIITNKNIYSQFRNSTPYGGPVYKITNFFKPTGDPKTFTEAGSVLPMAKPPVIPYNGIYVTDQIYTNRFMYLAYEPIKYKAYVFVSTDLSNNIFTKIDNLPLIYDTGFIKITATNAKIALLSGDNRWNNYCVVSKDNMKTWTKHYLPKKSGMFYTYILAANNILLAKGYGEVAILSLA